ncbi:hypothetical protein B9T38_13560 [Acinetobacter sp. ANC 4218]|uniref:hypothetical protein n=1 Tax=Acinetobacter sp. ANC 4218 TaxID=1977880 RepID=UPI000A33959A|nr:hypothetical protein [Acinetobacter sp. ANC 4218]OTG70044.1 hypothetical protein B9T38_13560 [Acinetobacter sp. ANC 4218]
MNILNSNEAFAAMMAGRNIMCRAIGELIEFNDIDQFPANIFAKPGYEFCIKVETMELAGITFEKPLTPDEVQLGDDVYIVQASGEIHHYKYVVCHEVLNQSIARGFAQRDPNNAQLQAEAFCKLFDRVYRRADIVEINTQTKQKRRSRKTEELAANDQNSTSNDVEEKTFESQSNIQITEPGPVTAVEENLTEEFVETDAVKLVEKFTAQIDECTTTRDVLALRPVFMANGHLEREDQQHLCKLTEDKLLELDPEQYTPKVELVNDLSVDELKRLQQEAEKLIQSQKDEHLEPPVQADVDDIHQVLLNELLGNVANAATPMEANAQIKYTTHWTEEQRKPLIDAINKRLVELNPPKAQSSLAVRIQKAEDLTELDALEIDVSACDEEIQPRLLELVEKRRLELDPFTAAIGEP